jgi:hypothetical protein
MALLAILIAVLWLKQKSENIPVFFDSIDLNKLISLINNSVGYFRGAERVRSQQ